LRKKVRRGTNPDETGGSLKHSIGARTIILPTPAWVIGTYDKEGKPNAMTAAWAGVCCSEPPCVAVSVRRSRHTFEGISIRKAFSVNVPSEDYIRETDYLGTVSGKKENKFEKSGLTAVKSDLIDAPYIDEFPLVLECRLVNTFELGIHTQFVGEIVDVKADEGVLTESGFPDIEKVKPFVYSPGTMSYHAIGNRLGRGFDIGKK
jgi:flavin reductase (DIM6/NTAB) family NADH-FMN oxidoreductase RutF